MPKVNMVLGFTIVFMIICCWWYWHMTSNAPDMNRVMFENVEFKTGDLILFHAYNNINPVFIGTFWGHIGIVYKDPDDPDSKPVLFEAAKTSGMKVCPDYNKHGIMITDLQTRVEKYPGLIACKILNVPINTNIIRGFTGFMDYCKTNMSYCDCVFRNALKKKLGEKLNNSTNCGEITFLSLIKLGLLPEAVLNQNISCHLHYVNDVKQVQNNYYHDPIEITFNPF